jgi:hypothetical protein
MRHTGGKFIIRLIRGFRRSQSNCWFFSLRASLRWRVNCFTEIGGSEAEP